MAPAPVRRWAVVHRAGFRGAQPDLWMVVEDVPAAVRMAEVRQALEAASWWPAWQRRIGLGASVRVVSERSWPGWLQEVAALEGAVQHERWERLTPESRRLSIPLEGDGYVLVRRAAAEAGQSMQGWAARQLVAAAQARLSFAELTKEVV